MWPKEHGSSVMVAAAFLAGGIVGWTAGPATSALSILAMALAVAGAFLLRRPLATLLSDPPARTRRRALRFAGLVATFTLAGVAYAFLTLPTAPLGVLGAASAPFYALGLMAVRWRSERALFVEAGGALGAALAAPAAYLSVRGALEPAALQALVACALFFLGGLLHVRSLFRRARPRGAEADVAARLPPAAWTLLAAGLALILVAVGWMALGIGMAAAAVALLRPVLLRGAVAARPMRVGVVESGLALAFLLVIVLVP
jgi:hypothetical protein